MHLEFFERCYACKRSQHLVIKLYCRSLCVSFNTISSVFKYYCMFINSIYKVVELQCRTWRGSSWFMLMKELRFSYAGWEPPFIHHMVKPRVYSRHFRNLTTIPKLVANHNSSTWLCTFLITRLSSYSTREVWFLSPVLQLSQKLWEYGKSEQVSEDGGFFRS